MKNNKIIEAIIFDLSGTLVDFGSLATIEAMKKVFKSKGITLTNNIIKLNMGIKKEKHIKKILNHPFVISNWIKKFKRPVNSSEIKILCSDFEKELIHKVKKNLNLIPNTKKIFKILKRNNIKIGITTGYPKKITKIILNYFKKKNLFFDYCVSDDEVKNSRPEPDMCLKNLKNLKIKNSKNCIKVDDSLSGIIEGKKAKMITVGLVSTGIQMGLTRLAYKKKANKDKINLKKSIKRKFSNTGADIVVNDHYEFEKMLNSKFSIN